MLESRAVKLTLQTQLLPDWDQAQKPSVVMQAFNAAADKRCPECSHVSKKNRIRRDVFLCDECGYFDHADIVGARNIRSGALVIAREVSVAAADRVSRETNSI
jgi:transposase